MWFTKTKDQKALVRPMTDAELTTSIVSSVAANLGEDLLRTGERESILTKISGSVEPVSDIGLGRRLQESGFRLWVEAATVVPRFRFAASVSGGQMAVSPISGRRYVTIPYPVGYGWGWQIACWPCIYTGDMPNWVIGRLKTVKDMGCQYVTIHSNKPMPVTFVQTEPVLIAWLSNPSIGVGDRGRYERVGNAIGVIVAMWDMERELTL